MHESGVDHKTGADLRKIAEKIRGLKDRGLDEGVSTRLLIYAGVLIKQGVAPRRACEVAIDQAHYGRCRDPEDTEGNRFGGTLMTMHSERQALDDLEAMIGEKLERADLVADTARTLSALLDDEGMKLYFTIVDSFCSLDRSLAVFMLKSGGETLSSLTDVDTRKEALRRDRQWWWCRYRAGCPMSTRWMVAT